MIRLSGSVCGVAAAVGAAFAIGIGSGARADEGAAAKRAQGDGRELFTREWIPGDKRSHGGDGLGPLFNDSSCVACHNQGGVGGAGPASKNAQILTAFRNVVPQPPTVRRTPQTLPERVFRSFFGDLDEPQANTTRTTTTRIVQVGTETAQVEVETPPRQPIAGPAAPPSRPGAPAAGFSPQQLEEERRELGRLHPGLGASPSVVLHRSATYDEYDAWRKKFLASNSVAFNRTVSTGRDGSESILFFAAEETTVSPHRPSTSPGMALIQQVKQEAQLAAQSRIFNQSSQHGNFAVTRSERNTTALFGEGLIDAIPESALVELEKEQTKKGIVSGRVSRLKDGKVGRLGWKAQTASLEDFVLTACAVELGLNVPGHAQAGVPHKLDYRPAGLDLNAEECRSLVNFVRDLPAPKQRPMADETDAAYVGAGRKLFDKVGCAACHVPDVSKAEGIYSDLLLHDMGPELGDSGGSYGIFVPDATPDGTPAPVPSLTEAQGGGAAVPPKATIGATRQEWRTPPLWGVRDSGPYLHDGRADSLEQAIAFHGGEAQNSATKFFDLPAAERFQVVTFLKSLVAPDAATNVATK